MTKRLRPILLVAACWLVTLLACAEDFRPAGAAIAHPAESPASRFAAEELAAFLQKVAGKASPVVEGDDGAIVLALRDDLGPEEVAYQITPKGIRIESGGERGLLYAVYVFCEEELGVRFLTRDHTHISAANEALALPAKTYRFQSPYAKFRRSYYGEVGADPLFASRLRQHDQRIKDAKLGGPIRFHLINHTLHNYVPSRKFGKEHPEYFAMIGGARRAEVKDDWGGHGTQLCYTNPDVLRIVIERTLADLKKHPERENISISQADNNFYCQCPECAAINEREETPMGALLTFVNQVAEAVEKEHPDVLVGTLAYRWSRKPPKHLKPRRNVQIQLCSFECCQMHAFDNPDCPLNATFAGEIEAWSQLTENLTVWAYCANFSNYLLPLPNGGTLDKNLRFLAQHHCIGMLMQGPWNGRGAEFSDLKNYVICKLLWNPDLNEADLVAEFCRLHYRDAAPAVQAILDKINGRRHPDLHRYCNGNAAQFGLDAQLGRELVLDFANAIESTDDAVVKPRLEKASVCAWRLLGEPWWARRDMVMPGKPAADLPPETYALFQIENDDDSPLPLPLQALLQLARRHEVTMATEGWSIEKVEGILQVYNKVILEILQKESEAGE